MARTIRARLARTLGLTAAVSVAVTALITFGLVRRYADQSAIEQLRGRGEAIAREAQTIRLGEAGALRRLLQASGDQIAFVAPRGGIQSDDAAARRVAQRLPLSRVVGGETLTGSIRTGEETYAYAAIPVSGARPVNSAVVLVRPVGLARDLWKPIAARVLIAAGLAALIAVGLSYALADRMTKPIRHVAEATALVAGGDLSARVPIERDDEVGELAARFNDMTAALAEARRREHEFLASVSHELRTPITAIRGYAEAIADGAVDPGELAAAVDVIRRESMRLERLVRDVMDLARLGAKEFRLEIADVDLAATLEETARAHAADAAEAGVALTAAPRGGLPAATDAARVRQILSNLVENALRVTPAGGSITLAGMKTGDTVTLEVADTGPGIAASDLPHVFERSYLWARSRGAREVGSGLGLAIVRELATALGGTLEVRSQPDAGTTFRLTLPPPSLALRAGR